MTTYCQEIQHTLLPTKASIWLFFLFIRPGTFLKQSLASSTFPRDPAQTETNKNMLQLHYIHWSCNVKNVCREWSGLCTAWDVSDNTTAAHQYFIYDTKSATEVQHRFRYYLTLISMVRGSVLEFDTGWADLRKQWSASDAIHGTPQTVRTHENLTESKKTFFNTVHDVWLYRAEDELTPKAFIFNSTAKKKTKKTIRLCLAGLFRCVISQFDGFLAFLILVFFTLSCEVSSKIMCTEGTGQEPRQALSLMRTYKNICEPVSRKA